MQIVFLRDPATYLHQKALRRAVVQKRGLTFHKHPAISTVRNLQNPLSPKGGMKSLPMGFYGFIFSMFTYAIRNMDACKQIIAHILFRRESRPLNIVPPPTIIFKT